MENQSARAGKRGTGPAEREESGMSPHTRLVKHKKGKGEKERSKEKKGWRGQRNVEPVRLESPGKEEG